MYNVLAAGTLAVSCYCLLRLLRPAGAAESILSLFLLVSGQIVLTGFLLSALGRLDRIESWALLGTAAAAASAAAAVRSGAVARLPRFALSPIARRMEREKNWYLGETSGFERLLLGPLLLTLLIVGLLNAIVVVSSAPHNWDSMTYHLARVGYYLQQGSLRPFEANYWAQVVHPTNATLLLLYSYLVSGRNENLTQLIQFGAYWVSVCALYGITRKAGGSKAQGLFAALIGGLLTSWLMESTTTQNDLVLTAFVGVGVYFLLAFRETPRIKYLGLAAAALGLAVGTKSSVVLALPSVMIVAVYALFTGRSARPVHWLAVFGTFASLAALVFVLPAGYADNLRVYGHPLGPAQVRAEHSFLGKPLSFVARHGTRNVLRYGVDFLSVDGVPAVAEVTGPQILAKVGVQQLVSRAGVDLQDSVATRMPFQFAKPPFTHEDLSYWGILGFGAVWIAVALAAAGKTYSTTVRVLAAGALVFVLMQGFAGPYDPWRGRYFITGALFAVPAVAGFLHARRRLARAYVLLIVLAGCLSALTAVVLRPNGMLVTVVAGKTRLPSIFTLDRIAQLTINRPEYGPPLRRFEAAVPAGTTVAVRLGPNSFEYLLFGERMTRKIVPLGWRARHPAAVPAGADYLLYGEGLCRAQPEDVPLGVDWYLREAHGRGLVCL